MNCVYLIPINSFTLMRRKWKWFFSMSTKTQQVIAHCWLNIIQLFYPNILPGLNVSVQHMSHCKTDYKPQD